MTRDPLGMATIFMDRFTGAKAGLTLDWASGYFLSKDHQMLLIVAEPVEPPQNVDFVKEMMVEVEAAIAEVLTQWSEIGTAGEPDQQNA